MCVCVWEKVNEWEDQDGQMEDQTGSPLKVLFWWYNLDNFVFIFCFELNQQLRLDATQSHIKEQQNKPWIEP